MMESQLTGLVLPSMLIQPSKIILDEGIGSGQVLTLMYLIRAETVTEEPAE